MSRIHGRRVRTLGLSGPYLITTSFAFVAVAPILVLAFNSLKTTEQMLQNPLGPPVGGLVFDNYVQAWQVAGFSTTMVNSLIVCAGTIVGVLLVATPAAYALSRLHVRGGNVFIMALLVVTSLPAQLFLVPLFFLWQRLGLNNTLQGLMIIYVGLFSPFQVLLLRAFMVSLPKEFEEAARVDGATTLQVIRHILLPLVRPGLLSVALLVGLAAWSEYLFAWTFLHDEDRLTVVTGLSAFVTRHSRDWPLTNAAAVTMTVPVVVVFLLFSRRFIEGLSRGALK